MTSAQELAALRRAANANLSRLASGQVRAEQRAKAESKRRVSAAEAALRRFDRQERAELTALVRSQRAELDSLEPYWQELMDQHTAGTISKLDYGALEEADHQRDTLLESIAAAEQRLAQLEVVAFARGPE